MTYCCESMDAHVLQKCDHHPDPFDCPDTVIVKTEPGFGLPIRDGGSSYIEIHYCPWCGKKLET